MNLTELLNEMNRTASALEVARTTGNDLEISKAWKAANRAYVSYHLANDKN